MPHESALDPLLAALDASLVQMERCRSENFATLVRPILLRRRRARVALRALMRWAGHPDTAWPSVAQEQAPRHTLYGLWRAEQMLIGLYDAALDQAGSNTLEKALLSAQRAEAEDAYLTITSTIQNRNNHSGPSSLAYGSFA